MEYAWAEPDPKRIKWAAFYGDCKHEILEVTRGHRITLTYNLYYSRIGDLGRKIDVAQQLPLYNIVYHILQEPSFMRQGKLNSFIASIDLA